MINYYYIFFIDPKTTAISRKRYINYIDNIFFFMYLKYNILN